jgi:two-component system response regulator VicR
MKVLVIEDDAQIVESISLTLQIRWPQVQVVSTHLGEEGVELAESEKPNVIILDLGLPDISGFDVLKRIRLFSSVPIVVLTVRTEEDNIFKALELGADDYIVKPCGRLELLARINVRTRGSRNNIIGGLPIYCGSLCFNPGTRQLLCHNKEVRLTTIEANIIHCLIKNGGQVVTYSELAEETWGDDYPGSLESLRVHIRRLRQKVEVDDRHPNIILTKPGTGYLITSIGESHIS